MRCKITRYGRSLKSGGWDPYGDSSTDRGLGNHDNILSFRACAITQAALQMLNAKNGATLKITFPDGRHQYRTIEDTAPEDEPRVDLLYYWIDDPTIPEYGEVELVT